MGEYMTVKEVAEKLRVGPATIKMAIRKNQLSAARIGCRYVIPAQSVDEYVKELMNKPFVGKKRTKEEAIVVTKKEK